MEDVILPVMWLRDLLGSPIMLGGMLAGHDEGGGA